VITYEEYHPYGTSALRVADGTSPVSDKRYRYTGKERDEETGLYYHGARYYAPWLGRWTAADPAGMVDGVDLYSYSRGNPVRWSDPGGQQTQTDDVPPIPAECLGGGEASWKSSCLASANEPRSVGGFEWVPDSYKGPLKPNQRRGDPYQRLAIDDPLGGAPLIGIENWRYEQLAETARARRFLQTLDNATSGGIPGAVGANISDEASDLGAWAMQTAASGQARQNSAGEGALGHLPNRYAKNAPIREVGSRPPRELKLLAAGGETSLSLEQVRRVRGGSKARGTAFEEHLAQLHGGRREVVESTPLGDRRQDLRSDTSTTQLAIEGKNYLRFRTVGGQVIEAQVQLTPELRKQIRKDFLWVREGRKMGQHRVAQWSFAGAGPSPDLSALLRHYGLPYVQQR
jgi:RHS repeat-associated protein